MTSVNARLYFSASFLTLASTFIMPVSAMIENESALSQARATAPCNILDVALEGRRPTPQELQETIRYVAKGIYETHGSIHRWLFRQGHLTIEGSGDTLTPNSSTPVDTTLDEATIKAVDWTGLVRIDAMVQSIPALQALIEKAAPTTSLHVEVSEILTNTTIQQIVPLLPRVAHLFLTVDRATTALALGQAVQDLITKKAFDPKEKTITVMLAGDFLEDVTFKDHSQPSQKSTVDEATKTQFKTLADVFGLRYMGDEKVPGWDILSLSDLFRGGVETSLTVNLTSSVAGAVSFFRSRGEIAGWRQATPSDTTIGFLRTWSRLRLPTIERVGNSDGSSSYDSYRFSRGANSTNDDDYVRFLRAVAETPAQTREILDKTLSNYWEWGDTYEERENLFRFVRDQPVNLQWLCNVSSRGAFLALSYLKIRAILPPSTAIRSKITKQIKSGVDYAEDFGARFRKLASKSLKEVLQKLTPQEGADFVTHAGILLWEETEGGRINKCTSALSQYPASEWESMARAGRHVIPIRVKYSWEDKVDETLSALYACESSQREGVALAAKRLVEACQKGFKASERDRLNENPLNFKIADLVSSLKDVPSSEREDVVKHTEAWIANLKRYDTTFGTQFINAYISLLSNITSQEREAFVQNTMDLFSKLSSVAQSGRNGAFGKYHDLPPQERRRVFTAGTSLLKDVPEKAVYVEHIIDLMELPAGADRESLVQLARPLVVFHERQNGPPDSRQSVILNLATIPTDDREDVVSTTKPLRYMFETINYRFMGRDLKELYITDIMLAVAKMPKTERATLYQQVQPLLSESLLPWVRVEIIKILAPLEASLRAEVIKVIDLSDLGKLNGYKARDYVDNIRSIALKIGKEGLPGLAKDLKALPNLEERLEHLEQLDAKDEK